MKRSWLNHRRGLILLVAALCLSSLLPAAAARVVSARPRALVQVVIAPVTDLLKRGSDRIRPSLSGHAGSDSLNQQWDANYHQLLAYARQLEDQLRDAREQIAQLSQIRQQLSLGSVELVPASVAAWPTGTQTLLIGRGGRHGLREGLVVADGFNLVGWLSDVTAMNGTVRLITAPRTHLMARIVPPAAGAPPREQIVQLTVDDDGRRFTARIDSNDPVQVGDLAHLSDSDWPAEASGLVIGRVEAIENDPQDPLLRRRLVVAPMRSLRQLSRVVVIVPGGDGA